MCTSVAILRVKLTLYDALLKGGGLDRIKAFPKLTGQLQVLNKFPTR